MHFCAHECANLCTFCKTGFFVKTHFFALFSKTRGSSMQYLGVSLGNLIDINKLLQQNTLFSQIRGGRNAPEGCRAKFFTPPGGACPPRVPQGVWVARSQHRCFKRVRSFACSCWLFVREKKL